jgi:hypothetical protein
MANDFVTVVLRRGSAEEVCNALIIALGGSTYGQGKGKKDDGGGEVYGGPKGKPEGKTDGGGKVYKKGKK